MVSLRCFADCCDQSTYFLKSEYLCLDAEVSLPFFAFKENYLHVRWLLVLVSILFCNKVFGGGDAVVSITIVIIITIIAILGPSGGQLYSKSFILKFFWKASICVLLLCD